MFENDQYCQKKIKKLENEWFKSLLLQSLTLCKYNLCSLHFTVCHISWDSKMWKMDQNIVSAPPPQRVFIKKYLLSAFRDASFPFFCSGKIISLATILPLALSLVKRETFSLSFFHLEGMEIWSQDDQMCSLCIFLKLCFSQKKVPPQRNPYTNVL